MGQRSAQLGLGADWCIYMYSAIWISFESEVSRQCSCKWVIYLLYFQTKALCSRQQNDVQMTTDDVIIAVNESSICFTSRLKLCVPDSRMTYRWRRWRHDSWGRVICLLYFLTKALWREQNDVHMTQMTFNRAQPYSGAEPSAARFSVPGRPSVNPLSGARVVLSLESFVTSVSGPHNKHYPAGPTSQQ